MATERQKKLKDPAEAALSAVEQALNLEPADDKQAAESGSDAEPRLPDIHDRESLWEPMSPPEPPAPPENGSVRDELNVDSPPQIVAPDHAAVANDDRRSVGMVLQALQARPSRRSYVLAALASLIWVAGLGGLLWLETGGNLAAHGL
jgi:hypothetical protein